MISPAPSVEQVLSAAREHEPPDRAAFLDSVCLNSPDVRQAVEQRLREEECGSESTLDWSGSWPSAHGGRSQAVSPPASLGRFAPGQIIAGRFTILRYIAKGGMGEVYEVEDQFLQGVHVALKVIRPEIAGDSGSSHRFEQEVLLARKVSHPNLCPIYHIDRSSDPPPAFLFLTMKLLDGETLSARLKRSEPVPRDEKLAIFRQMIAGVSAIHAQRIIHRDIKPNNVMLDYSGPTLCLSIMDFGLARLHEADATMLSGSLMAGTPGYMAPEILHGQGPSQATDLFALGVLLHQVATGEHPPFGALSHSVEPSPALDKADLPALFIQTVKAFLSNDPKRRCDFAASLTADLESQTAFNAPRPLRRVTTIGAIAGLFLLMASLLLVPAVGERLRGILFASRQKHIVVLPFQLAGNNPETQALGDGLMDSLAGKLSNLDTNNESLWVIPATEVRSRKVTDPSSAMHEFGATLVVEGRLDRDNGATHLKLTLIDPEKMREIGYLDVGDESGDMSSLQDQAVVGLGRLMNVSLKQQRLSKPEAPVSRAAYQDYLVALGYSQRFDQPGNLDRAIAALQNALNTDPRFTLGLARLAQVYVMKYRMDKNPLWLKQAQTYAEQALQLDGGVPLAHVALGQVEQFTGHHDLAAQEFHRAIDLDPKDPEALTGLALSDRDLGRNSEAETIYIRAAKMRPDDWTGYGNLGQFYERMGRTGEAIAQYNRALELSPDNSGLYVNLGVAYLNAGDPKMIPQAEQAFHKSIAINPNYHAYANLAIVYGAQHRLAESVASIIRALKLNDKDYQVWNNLAEGYEWLGDEQNAAAARKRERVLLDEKIKVDPQDAEAQATLALMFAKDNLPAAALDKIQVALAIEPHNQSVLSDIADSYEVLGNRSLAIRYLQRALANGMPAADLKTDPYVKNVLTDRHFHLPRAATGA